MNKSVFSTFSESIVPRDLKGTVGIWYNNNMKNAPRVIVIEDGYKLSEIIRRNCRHHKFNALNNNDILVEQFNEEYTLDTLDDKYYGYHDDKCVILHFINNTEKIKEYVDRFNSKMSILFIDEIKHRRKELRNLKKAYCN